MVESLLLSEGENKSMYRSFRGEVLGLLSQSTGCGPLSVL